jgi:Raffinose synthase or seed imbibition protein Sip1
MACARNKLWWMTPEWGTAVGALPSETQFLLLDHGAASGTSASTNSASNNSADGHSAAAAGPYSVLLPLLDGAFRGTLRAERNRCAAACSLLSLRAWFAAPVLFAHDVPEQATRYPNPNA